MESYTREELLQGFSQDFRAAGFPPALEAKAAQVATDSLLRRCTGHVYIRRGRKTTSQRDRLVLAAFDGRNQMALAQQYGLSVRRVEQIIAAHLRDRKVIEDKGEPK
jgi:Mor family transcriptional regulator